LRTEFARASTGTQVYRAISGMQYTREIFIAAKREEQVLAPFCYRGTCDTVFFQYVGEGLFTSRIKAGASADHG
jgi:hypothetical protein